MIPAIDPNLRLPLRVIPFASVVPVVPVIPFASVATPFAALISQAVGKLQLRSPLTVSLLTLTPFLTLLALLTLSSFTLRCIPIAKFAASGIRSLPYLQFAHPPARPPAAWKDWSYVYRRISRVENLLASLPFLGGGDPP